MKTTASLGKCGIIGGNQHFLEETWIPGAPAGVAFAVSRQARAHGGVTGLPAIPECAREISIFIYFPRVLLERIVLRGNSWLVSRQWEGAPGWPSGGVGGGGP